MTKVEKAINDANDSKQRLDMVQGKLDAVEK